MRRIILAVALCAAPLLARAQPVDGFYVAGSGGVNALLGNHVNSFSIGGAPLKVSNYAFDVGGVGLASVGYGFGHGLRLELEGSYRDNAVARTPNGTGVTSRSGQEAKYGAMVNALYDFSVGLPWIKPHVGVGIGSQWTDLTESIEGPGADAERGGTDARSGYQAMLGFAVPVPGVPGLSLTVEYRFLGLAGTHEVTGARTSYLTIPH